MRLEQTFSLDFALYKINYYYYYYYCASGWECARAPRARLATGSTCIWFGPFQRVCL